MSQRFFIFLLSQPLHPRCVEIVVFLLLIMGATWLSEASSAQMRAFRAAWLSALFAGLVQKPRVALAWDVLATIEAMRSLHALEAAPMVMGATLILLRQIYAEKGQQCVATMARRLVRRKQGWSEAALRSLAAKLESMDRENIKKLKGRSALHTGPQWIRKIVQSRSNLEAFHHAGRYLGLTMSAHAEAGSWGWISRQSFGDAFQFLLSPVAKMP